MERKTVERYTMSMQFLSTPKTFLAEKGSDTQLKDIPNGNCVEGDAMNVETAMDADAKAKENTDTRDLFGEFGNIIGDRMYYRALVAASIGSYGICKRCGLEYAQRLSRCRLQVLVGSAHDLLAFETFLNKLEYHQTRCVEYYTNETGVYIETGEN
ncbi:hypothetical protein E3N88_04029 [Mikania micrantha]|uniref:Uncharacterized protein n=1 Tax=Mikania micrantha TaxID=192012 RepID=A0A5N6PVE9_9ASTR|nr:hypothetical protein E3N88_04029 [Mikania micrantha]